jgi:hypothetical protein
MMWSQLSLNLRPKKYLKPLRLKVLPLLLPKPLLRLKARRLLLPLKNRQKNNNLSK